MVKDLLLYQHVGFAWQLGGAGFPGEKDAILFILFRLPLLTDIILRQRFAVDVLVESDGRTIEGIDIERDGSFFFRLCQPKGDGFRRKERGNRRSEKPPYREDEEQDQSRLGAKEPAKPTTSDMPKRQEGGKHHAQGDAVLCHISADGGQWREDDSCRCGYRKEQVEGHESFGNMAIFSQFP